jgi:hypothetical protein
MRLKESGNWKPQRWSPRRISAFRRHALREIDHWFRPYDAALVYVEVATLLLSADSSAQLHRAGVQTIGDQQVAA